MNVFITGATGFIGSCLALKLAENGNKVHALYRSFDKTDIIQHPNIKLFKGDIMDLNSLQIAMKGCDQVYHTAAFTKAWCKDVALIYRLNIEGTLNVIRTGIKEGIKRFVCTSTAGVLGPSIQNVCIDETSAPPDKYFIDYEFSKALLENILITLSLKGPEIIIVNPSRVYGPGVLNESNSVTRIIKLYMSGKWRLIPGNGKSIGNYVFIDDVVNAHILAMEKGKSGERYVISGSNISYNELIKVLVELTGMKFNMFHIPIFLMMIISRILLIYSKIFDRKPLITPSLVRKYSYNFYLSSDKAQKELGYNPVNFKTGAKMTIDWLNSHPHQQTGTL